MSARPDASVRARFARSARARCDDADLPWPPGGWWVRLAAVAAAVTLVAAVAGSWPLVLVMLIGVVVAAVVASETVRGRAGRRVDAALPAVLENAARSLRSGTSLRAAILEAAATAPSRLRDGLDSVARTAGRGTPLVDAIDHWAAETPGDGVRLAAAALALSAELGGAAARSLDGVAATLRDRNAARAEVRALSSQARASAMVIGVAPIAFAFVASTLDARATEFLLRTPAGIGCLLAGVTLDGVGALWMHRLAVVS